MFLAVFQALLGLTKEHPELGAQPLRERGRLLPLRWAGVGGGAGPGRAGAWGGAGAGPGQSPSAPPPLCWAVRLAGSLRPSLRGGSGGSTSRDWLSCGKSLHGGPAALGGVTWPQDRTPFPLPQARAVPQRDMGFGWSRHCDRAQGQDV